MELVQTILVKVSDFLLGFPLMISLLGTGLFLTIRLGLVQFRHMPRALRMIFMPPKDKSSPGDVQGYLDA